VKELPPAARAALLAPPRPDLLVLDALSNKPHFSHLRSAPRPARAVIPRTIVCFGCVATVALVDICVECVECAWRVALSAACLPASRRPRRWRAPSARGARGWSACRVTSAHTKSSIPNSWRATDAGSPPALPSHARQRVSAAEVARSVAPLPRLRRVGRGGQGGRAARARRPHDRRAVASCVCACVFVCLCACVFDCLRARVRVRVFACACVFARVCLCGGVHDKPPPPRVSLPVLRAPAAATLLRSLPRRRAPGAEQAPCARAPLASAQTKSNRPIQRAGALEHRPNPTEQSSGAGALEPGRTRGAL
jgi:hypothetical protein